MEKDGVQEVAKLQRVSERYRGSRKVHKPARKAGKKLIKLLFRLILLSALFFLLKTGHALLSITEIKVIGAEIMAPGQVIEGSGIEQGSSLLFLHRSKTEERLLALPPITAAEVRKIYPSSVEIRVQERKPAACILAGGSYWVVDELGFVYDEWTYLSYSLPVVTGIEPEEVSPGSFLDNWDGGDTLGIILQGLSEVPLLEVAEINIRDRSNIILITADGRKALLGDSDKMGQKLTLVYGTLPYLEEGEKDKVLDVRTGDSLVVIEDDNRFTGEERS